MIYFSNKKFIRPNDLGYHGWSMVIKTPNFFTPRPYRGGRGIWFRVLEIIKIIGWKKLKTLLEWRHDILRIFLNQVHVTGWKNASVQYNTRWPQKSRKYYQRSIVLKKSKWHCSKWGQQKHWDSMVWMLFFIRNFGMWLVIMWLLLC